MATVRVVVREVELYPCISIMVADEDDQDTVEIDQALLDRYRAAEKTLEEIEKTIVQAANAAGIEI